MHFLPDLPIVIPLPICPVCDDPILPLGFLQTVTLAMPEGISARIVDSSGAAVVTNYDNSPFQLMQFQPLPYGATPFFFPLGQAPQADPLGPPAADGVRYRLELYPGEGLNVNQTYVVTVTLSSQTPSVLYLPAVGR